MLGNFQASLQKLRKLGGRHVSDIFYFFFRSGDGKGESGATGEGGGGGAGFY